MIKEVFSHGRKYFASSVISAAISFLMTKYYTQSFSPSDFGTMTLYVMIFEYISIMGTLSTEQAVSRKMFDFEKENRVSYLSSVFWLYIFTTTILLIIGLSMSEIISELILEDSYDIYIFSLFSGGAMVFYKLFNIILVNEKKSTEVFKASVSNSILSSLLSITSISFFQFGIVGRFLGQLVGIIYYIIYALTVCKNLKLFKFKRTFNYREIKETILLSIPVIFSTIMVLLFSYTDRIFLKTFDNDTSVGLYGLALIIGKVISMIFESLSSSFFPTAMNNLNREYSVGIKEIENLSYKYYIFLLIIFLILYATSPFLVEAISNSEYSDTQIVIPFIFLGIVSGGLYKLAGAVLMYHKVIWFYPAIAFVSFFTNATLNYFLIPIHGLLGAGLSTAIGHIIYSFSIQFFSFNYFSIRYVIITSAYYCLIIFVALSIFFISK